MKITTTVLPAGPTKRVWVNKHVLREFGGGSPTSPVWEVECEGVRYSGYLLFMYGWAAGRYVPSDGDGPHAFLEVSGELIIRTAAEEAA